MSKLTLQVFVASTRPGRAGPMVADWFMDRAREHDGFELELVDLAAVGLPLLDEPNHPRLAQYEHEHTRAWSETVSRADAFVFVTPEYDHSAPAALSNALQYLVREWAYKPVGFVSYGGVSAGLRSVQVTKLTANALRMVPVVEAVSLPFFARDLDRAAGVFKPDEVQYTAARAMLDELLKVAHALKPLR